MGKMKQLFGTPKKAAVSGICLGCILAVLGAGTAFAATAIAKGSSIGEENAKNFAFADLGIDPLSASNVRAEFDFEQGQFVYEIEFTANGMEYEYWIKASDGTVVKKEMDWAAGMNQAKDPNPITLEQAKETALSDAGLSASEVTFTKAEADIEDGHSVYDIEFYAGNTEYEYEINRTTGAIYSKSRETLTPQGIHTPVQEETLGTPVPSQPAIAQPQSEAWQAASQQGASQLSMDSAKNIAVSDAGLTLQEVSFTKAETDYEDGILIYEIDFYTSTHKYDYEIVVSTGAILSREKEIIGNGHGHVYDTPSTPGSLNPGNAGSDIGPEQAQSIAVSHAGLTISDVTFIKTESDYEDGVLVYEVEFYTSTHEYDYDIAAATGSILSSKKEIHENGHGHDHSTPVNSGNAGFDIGLEQAKSTALSHAGFTISDVIITKAETDYEDGILVYEIEFYQNGMEYEYEINAMTGEILKFDSEWDD